MREELQNIAESLDSDESYAGAYARAKRNNVWLAELLDQAYMEMGDKIALVSTKSGHEYIRYLKAAEILDKAVLTTVSVYETYIATLEKKLNAIGTQ